MSVETTGKESDMAWQGSPTRARLASTWAALSVALLLHSTLGSARAYEVVLSTQGEYMDGYLVTGKAFPPRVIVNDPDPAASPVGPGRVSRCRPTGSARARGARVLLLPNKSDLAVESIHDNGAVAAIRDDLRYDRSEFVVTKDPHGP
jgi:hypothetical protein